MTLRRILSFVVMIAIIGGVAFYVTSRGQQKDKAASRKGDLSGPVPVLVAPARLADVPVYLDGVGTTKPLNMVTVRSQVDGQLIKVDFREGQDVKRGDLLAEIDPRTYQAQLDQALAKKAQDEAQLANARLDLDRYQKLAAANAGSKQQADTARATVAQLEAQVRSDQAAIDNTRTLLSYTRITSPLDGRTGIRQVDEGNIVHPSDTNGIVVITQLRPISVVFTLPQQQVSDVNKAFTQGALSIETLGVDGRTVVDRGTLLVVDNQVDQTTGTVRLKAEFPNASLQLWPGQFVNVRLLIATLQQVVVVPTAAVQRGPSGTFVYTLQADDTVAVQSVTVSQQDDTRAVIASGLSVDAKVVTSGFTRLAAGTKVTVQSADAPQPDGATPPGQRKKGRKGQAPESALPPDDTRRSDMAPNPSK